MDNFIPDNDCKELSAEILKIARSLRGEAVLPPRLIPILLVPRAPGEVAFAPIYYVDAPAPVARENNFNFLQGFSNLIKKFLGIHFEILKM
ncbi:MAG: hypothetical protein LBP36_00455 [Oscillospiraceae bacterium]|nr:hypothetical protein [Oscillospiraceae bacterium]